MTKASNKNKQFKLQDSKRVSFKKNDQVFVGIDLHKKSFQIAVVDKNDNLLLKQGINNDISSIKKIFTKFPKNAKYVIESSSV